MAMGCIASANAGASVSSATIVGIGTPTGWTLRGWARGDGAGCGIALRKRPAAVVAARKRPAAAPAAAAARKRPAAALSGIGACAEGFWAWSKTQRDQVRARLMRMNPVLDPEESLSSDNPDRSSSEEDVTLYVVRMRV